MGFKWWFSITTKQGVETGDVQTAVVGGGAGAGRLFPLAILGGPTARSHRDCSKANIKHHNCIGKTNLATRNSTPVNLRPKSKFAGSVTCERSIMCNNWFTLK